MAILIVVQPVIASGNHLIPEGSETQRIQTWKETPNKRFEKIERGAAMWRLPVRNLGVLQKAHNGSEFFSTNSNPLNFVTESALVHNPTYPSVERSTPMSIKG